MYVYRRYGNLFRLDGTNQLQRFPLPLTSTYIQPDERSLADLVRYVKRVAEQIRYYNLSGQAVGDWRAFFSALERRGSGEIMSDAELESLLTDRRDWPPHVALFLVFLRLYQILQGDINELPVRHLRHYYENELGLQRRQAVRDSVHVVLELARNASPARVEAGTKLDGGRDANGNPLVYSTASEIIIAPTEIAESYRLVRDVDRRGNPRFFTATSPSEAEGQSWHTFGRGQLDLDATQRFMEEAEIGFALASPLLLLAEGRREIHIALDLGRTQGELPPDHHFGFALRAQISGEEGWLTPEYFDAHLVNNGIDPPVLDITLLVEESSAPIVCADSETHPGSPTSPWPVARFLLLGESGHYSVLEGIRVENAQISVSVSGVKNLIVQNELGVLAAEKPISLFGNQPHVGSAFYIGSDEVFGKRLTSLTVDAAWQDKPADLFDHYREYFQFVNSTLEDQFVGSFTVDIDMLYRRSWVPLLNNQRLFDFARPDQRQFALDLSDDDFLDTVFGEDNYRAQPDIPAISQFTTASKFGFLRIVLRGPSYDAPWAADIPYRAFGHRAFSPRYARLAIESSRSTDSEVTLPKEPYTPTLSSLTIGYTATSTYEIGDIYSEDRFFTLDAFGAIEADSEVQANLVPPIRGQASLFIGIRNSPVPTTVSLLFQLDRGTATAAEALGPGETRWAYLSDKVWKDIPASEVLIDTTGGFQRPGIVSMAVGQAASIEHQRMPTELLWLRASIDRPADSACRVYQIRDRAVRATLDVSDEELPLYETHLQSALPAETISKLSKRNAVIKKVEQPYEGFGGSGSEQDLHYFQSSSERLRHRQRAVTFWDMEHLVLDAFPAVFKVKCLPHSDAQGQRKAGELALVIIPDLRSTTTSNPLEPRADAVLMSDIESFVRQLATPYATCHVIHPVYERILVDAHVAFLAGFDAGYYARILSDELTRFLSPWAFEEGQDIVFGTSIYRSEILAYMEGREYVDYVTNFSLYHSYAGTRRDGIGEMAIEVDLVVQARPVPAINDMEIGSSFVVGHSVEVASAASGHAILVSRPQHRITPVSAATHECQGVDQLGIGYMTVELNFEVARQ